MYKTVGLVAMLAGAFILGILAADWTYSFEEAEEPLKTMCSCLCPSCPTEPETESQGILYVTQDAIAGVVYELRDR